VLDAVTVRRLGFIRYLYDLAVRQSFEPEPLGAASLLTFHDSIELFLALAAERRGVAKTGLQFMQYWEQLDGLGHKTSMGRLNGARVGLKHHGTLPSRLDIEAFRSATTAFFEESTPLLFGIGFDAISLISLVANPTARAYLETAELLVGKKQPKEALSQIALAFDELLEEFDRQHQDAFGSSRLRFAQDFSFDSAFFLGVPRGQFGRFLDKLRESVEALGEATRIIALGLDYLSYARFRALVPTVLRFEGGSTRVYSGEAQDQASQQDGEFCLRFVVDTALRLQALERSAPA
jgi:hypothetical protein